MKNYHAKAGMRGWAWKWKPSRAWGVGLKTKIITLKRARGGRNSSVGSSVSSWKARCNTDVGSNPWGCGKGVFSQSQLPLQILLQCLHSPLPAIAGINTGAYVKNPKRWQLNHCLDTGKCCTHWQEWAALTMPLPGHRKMLHTLTGMGSTALAAAVQTASYLWTADHWDWRWADHNASREQMTHYLWRAYHWYWQWADHDTSREQTTCYLQRADHWDWQWADHNLSREQTTSYLWRADRWHWQWADHNLSREQTTSYLWRADRWHWQWADHNLSREQTTSYLWTAYRWDWQWADHNALREQTTSYLWWAGRSNLSPFLIGWIFAPQT